VETIEFDIRGQICPSSLLVALKEVNSRADGLRQGSLRLCFFTDNRDATVTIPESASNMGYGVSVEKKDGYYCIVISGKKG
jgi:TusA-related sulfurtransferase